MLGKRFKDRMWAEQRKILSNAAQGPSCSSSATRRVLALRLHAASSDGQDPEPDSTNV